MDNNLTIRQKLELRNMRYCPYAAFSDQSQGRDYEEEPCNIRPVHQRTGIEGILGHLED